MTKKRLIRKRGIERVQAVMIIAGTIVVGLIIVTLIQAGTNVIAFEAERGTLSGGATTGAVTTASGGSYLQFAAGNPPTPTPTPPPSTGIIRGIFYYPWFPQTWGSGMPFTNYHPVNGYYSSDDPLMIAKHIAEMRYAHLNTGISSWWGQLQQKENTRLPLQLTAATDTGFKWSLYYEKEGFGNPAVSELSGDLAYIKLHYAANPNFLVLNGKPVIFVYADGGDGCAMADRWKQANSSNTFYLVLKVFPGYAGCASQPDAWHQYGPASPAQSGPGYYAIAPGYYKKGDAAPLNPRDPARWRQNVSAMAASGAKFQLVTTFNEWGEGTAVEPATEWSSPSGNGVYLDALHDLLPAS